VAEKSIKVSIMKNAICTLTKIKSWYIPVDPESYNILKKAGVPLVRIHENMLPTLAMLFKKNKFRAKSVDFKETILDPYLEEIGRRWNKKDHRKATISSSTMRFETDHASIAEATRKIIPDLEASLRRFFQRWGYSATFELSENRGKIRFFVTYKFDQSKNPIIPLVEDPAALPIISLDLGYVRLRMTCGEKEVEVNISVAAGTTWTSLHTSRCLYSQISDVRPMLGALMGIVSKDEHNADNRPR